jgi:hypothetical protein
MQHPSTTIPKKRQKMIDEIIKNSVCAERSYSSSGDEILQMTVTIEKFAELYDLMSEYAFSEHGKLQGQFEHDQYICITISKIAKARWGTATDWKAFAEDTYATFRRAFPTVIKNGVDIQVDDTFPSWIKKKAMKVMDLEIGEFDEVLGGVTNTEFRSKFLNLMAQIAPNKLLLFTVKQEFL